MLISWEMFNNIYYENYKLVLDLFVSLKNPFDSSSNLWVLGRPGMLQFMGSQRVGHDWATELNWTDGSQEVFWKEIILEQCFYLGENSVDINIYIHTYMCVYIYTYIYIEYLYRHIELKCMCVYRSFWDGAVVKNPLANAEGIPLSRKWEPCQYSCLEKPIDRGAWWATVYGVAKS